MYKFKFIKLIPNKGFALLISVIISAIIMTIGITIVNSAIKEVILSSTVRNSLESFYMANSGVECALYWDNVRGNFEKESAFFHKDSSPGVIECRGIEATVNGPSDFWLIEEDTNLACVNVDLEAIPVGPDELKFVVSSWGFNTCNEKNTRRVDRALEVKYSRFR